MMAVVVKTGAITRAKLQTNRHHQQTNTQLFKGWLNKNKSKAAGTHAARSPPDCGGHIEAAAFNARRYA